MIEVESGICFFILANCIISHLQYVCDLILILSRPYESLFHTQKWNV